MAEYINKEQLLSHLFSKQDEPLDVMKEIAEFPAAEVAEVRHGRWKWIFGKPYCEFCAVEPYRASNKDMPNYCSNCGACMDKEDEK